MIYPFDKCKDFHHPKLVFIARYSVGLAWLCMICGAGAAIRSLLLGNHGNVGPGIIAMAVGLLIWIMTDYMWNYSRFGRNVTVVLCAAISYKLLEFVGAKTGGGVWPEVLVAIYASVALTYFTSDQGKADFAPPHVEGQSEGAELEDADDGQSLVH